MGASASIYWDALNDDLTEEEVKMILGDEFNEKEFNALRDQKTGHLQRTVLMEIIHNHKLLEKEAEVKEIYYLFMQVCPNGEMSRQNFISFCKEAKLLSKKVFPRVEADILFGKALQVPKIISKTVNFRDFMRVCVPLIAEKMKMEMEVILHKLASVDRVAPTAEEREADILSMSEATKEEIAARKIQTSSRRKSTMQRQKGMAAMEVSARNAGPEYFDVPADPSLNEEQKIADVFRTVCRPKEDMDLPCCLKLCKDSKIVQEQFFSSHDVQLAFLKAKSIALNKDAYKAGVIINKRFNYKVFREILIPCLAEKKTSKAPSAESTTEIKHLLSQMPSDHVQVETESTEALKNFFSILQSGADNGEAAQMNRLLKDP